MEKEYDFSKAKKGPVTTPSPGKIRITIRLDRDVVEYFRGVVERNGGGNYQSLMNEALREHMDHGDGRLEKALRKIIREELKKAG